MTALAPLLPLLLALIAAPAAMLAGTLRRSLVAPVGSTFTMAAFLATVFVWYGGGGSVDFAWAPAWDLRFAISLDGLAALYALLATGVGFLVLVYSSRYLPLHLDHEGRPESEKTRFYGFMLLFMGSMVGLAMAQDLILLFVFWDLTAIASYYLIGYDRHDADARASALMALLVTGVTAVFLLIAALLLHSTHATFSVTELARLVEPGVLLDVAGLLICVAALAKSAQVPLHFWLPRAMAAPTPVSAYLHSAAMVAAGVLLIGRTYPVLQESQVLLDALLVVGLLSIAVGGVLALTRDVLKQLLAYSTISQYGYVVFMYGLGGEYGVAGACVYVTAHALGKCALFLTAGAATEATGEDRLSAIGGLKKPLPLLAVTSGAAAASIAALPLTIGFFGDEVFFKASLEKGPVFAGFAVVGAALTLAYLWRFWSGLFLGRLRDGTSSIPTALIWPVVVLGLLVLSGGFYAEPFAVLAEEAGAASYGTSIELELSYHLDLRAENLMALGTFALGTLIVVSRPLWEKGALTASRLGDLAGPQRLYELSVDGLNRLSDYAHRAEVRDLRSRVAAILLPAGLLVGAGTLFTPTVNAYRVGELGAQDLPLLLALCAAVVASLATTFVRRHVTLALVLSGSGFTLALVYAFFGAPDVALVAVLVEAILTLLFLGTSKLIPYEVLHRQAELPLQKRRRTVFFSLVASGFALAVVWGALSQPAAETTVAEEHVRLAEDAHAKDVVTAILADFRGLDTLGEITVVAIVLLGVATLLNRGRLAASDTAIRGSEATGVMTRTVAKLLFLPTLLVAAAILVKGYAQTGDGFSAGVVASLGVLLQYLAFGRHKAEKLPLIRFAGKIAFIGLLVTLLVATAPVFLDDPVLTHYPSPGEDVVYLGTVELITPVLFDVGVFLLVLGFVVGTVNLTARAIADEEEHRSPDSAGAKVAADAKAPLAGKEDR
ncbi:MAG TPA: hydrogen gas-evolving membrane-bound hydrogenase subunit E [Rubrobacteraceae bacterium]|nr:hydrogen gas-evolving membrane-bound hydrogenase subunit E [Rubrobacteraceae bacterium]